MARVFLSTVVGVLAGIGLGLFVGWVIAPVEYTDSPMSALAPRFQEEYTLMIAAGYVVDRDSGAAIERLSRLGVENVPAYVQELTERYITNSRNVADIRLLVALSEGLGRLTPPMESFREIGGDQ
jgi:hypothetical protein